MATYIYCYHIIIFTSEKVKTYLDIRQKKYIYNYCSCITIFIIRKAKTSLDIRQKKLIYSYCHHITLLIYLLFSTVYLFSSQLLYITIFTSEKAKTAKDILDKKATAAGKPAADTLAVFILASQFLQAEKRKPVQIRAENAHPQLMPPQYNHDFYKRKSENWSEYKLKMPTCNCYPCITCSCCSCCPCNTIFTSGKAKTGICDYRLQVHVALYTLGKKSGTCNYQSQIYVALHILGGKQDTCNRPGLRYMLHLIFSLDKQVTIAGTHRTLYFGWENRYLRLPVAGIRCASYFEWVNRYLQPARSHVHVAHQVLGRYKGTWDRPGCRDWPGRRYTSRLMFHVGRKVPATGLVSGKSFASGFGQDQRYLGQPRLPTGQIAGTLRASCFGRVERYLQTARSQVYVMPHDLTGQVSGLCCASRGRYKSIIRDNI